MPPKKKKFKIISSPEENKISILIQQYIDSFTEEEKIAYNIASSHLKTSFDIEKSIGFIEFMNNQ